MPEVHIRGDINTPYKCIGGTVFNAARWLPARRLYFAARGRWPVTRL